MEQKTKNRITYIDVFRGLLMLLVVLGHSIGNTTDPVNKVILSFHMPAFFLLSGMCFRPKSGVVVSDALKRKARGLAWPYFTFSLMGVALYWLLLAGTSKDQGVTITQTLIGVFWNDGQYGTIVTAGYWFVYDLAWISLIHIITNRVNRYIRLAITIAVFLGLYEAQASFYFSVEVIRIAAGYMFFLLGDIFVASNTELKLNQTFRGGYLWLLLTILFMSATIVASHANVSVKMYANEYGSVSLFMVSTLGGTISIYTLARFINSNRLIEYVGRNSIIVLFIHFFALMISHVVLQKIMPGVENYSFPFYLLHFAVAVSASLGFSWAVNRFAPWMQRL